MKKFLSKKAKLVSLAMLFAAGTSFAATVNCDDYARAERLRFCTQIGADSACAMSQALYNHFYQQCQRNSCSG